MIAKADAFIIRHFVAIVAVSGILNLIAQTGAIPSAPYVLIALAAMIPIRVAGAFVK